MHHQMVLIESGGKTAVFAADLMPTTAHVPDAWIMGYDLYPMDTLAAKKRVRARGDRARDLVFFEHDPAIAAGYIREAERQAVDRFDHSIMTTIQRIGIIGGSGLYDMAELTDREEQTHHDAVRRSVRPVHASARCAASGSRSWRATAPATASCRPS